MDNPTDYYDIQRSELPSKTLEDFLSPEDLKRYGRAVRNRRVAESIINRAMQPRQGAMAGRFYAPPSWGEGLTNLAQAGIGSMMLHGVPFTDYGGVYGDMEKLQTQAMEGKKTAQQTGLQAIRAALAESADGAPLQAAPAMNSDQQAGQPLPFREDQDQMPEPISREGVKGSTPGTTAAKQSAPQGSTVDGASLQAALAMNSDQLEAQHPSANRSKVAQSLVQAYINMHPGIQAQLWPIVKMALDENNRLQQHGAKLAEQDAKIAERKYEADLRAETERNRAKDTAAIQRAQAEEAARHNRAMENINRLIAQQNAQRFGLKPGERVGKDGLVELIPGTQAYLTQKGKWAKDLGTWKMGELNINNTVQDIDKILDKKKEQAFSALYGGLSAYATQQIPSDEIQDIRNAVQQLRSQFKAKGTQIVRQAGSPGHITEREWPIMEEQLAKLDNPRISAKEARDILENVKTRLIVTSSQMKDVYDSEWAGSQFERENQKRLAANPAAPQPAAAGERGKPVTPTGKPRIYNPATGKIENGESN